MQRFFKGNSRQCLVFLRLKSVLHGVKLKLLNSIAVRIKD